MIDGLAVLGALPQGGVGADEDLAAEERTNETAMFLLERPPGVGLFWLLVSSLAVLTYRSIQEGRFASAAP
ncbi:MAG: hypothetical protein B7Z37_19820 [Verrucomicrobia bacterium 12-59-8]|nr:MAG: hypothetical protein B7Z37_19820 [Verrucomicrobia bacterium 12-59-8]